MFTTLLIAPSLALLQDTDPASTAPAAAPAPTVLFDLWMDDLRLALPSPKDAGLVRALGLIDARLGELPNELADQMPPMPPAMLPLLGRMALARKSLRVFALPDAPLPFAVRLEMQEADAAAAQRVAETVFALLEEVGAPLGPVGANGLAMLEMPDGPPVDLGASGSAFVVDFGGAAATPGAALAGLLPASARPLMTMRMDVGSMVELLGSFMAERAPEEADEMIAVMDRLGLSRMSFELAAGMDAERSHTVLRMPGYGASLRANGLLAPRMLGAADYAVVPTDAEWAMVTTMNAAGTLEFMLSTVADQLREVGVDDPLAEFTAQTGFDLRSDVVAHLGSSAALYSSETTGGGGMFSIVGVVELANRDGLAATLLRARDMVDNLGATEADGYVRVRTFEHGADTLHSLVFPGLPVPLELTIALGEKHLVAGLTPQAVLGALGQIRSGGAGLLANTAFTQQLASDAIGAMSVQFVDSAAMASDAYGLASLVCSALANMTRSPGTQRDAGLVMPTYAEFVQGALATVTVARLEGDDFVERGRADQSMLVNMAGTLGMVASSPLGLVVGMGVASAMIADARSSAASDWSDLGYIDDMGYVDDLGYTEEPAPAEEPEEPTEEPGYQY
jgi:hypothetical protein